MAHPQKHPLRPLSEQEARELQRLVKASSERLDVVRRAKALVAVAAGQSFTQAAQQAALKSGDGVGKLLARFNEHGLAALSIAAGRGRKATSTSEQRARILQEVQRQPDREQDGTATWSFHLSYDLVQWFFEHGVMPLYTPVGGSWLNMAESVQHIIVRRALSGQHPKDSQQVIDC
jgi:transposase